VADRGTLTRYCGYRGNKIPGVGLKLTLLPGSLILSYHGLEEGNLDQKSPGPPVWGLMLITKKQKMLKNLTPSSSGMATLKGCKKRDYQN